MGQFTLLTNQQIAALLNQFKDLPEESFKVTSVPGGTVNTYYHIKYKSGLCLFLKIDEVGNEKRLKDEIHIFKMLIQNKNKLGFQFPEPYQTRKGTYYVPFEKKFVLLLSAISGKSLYKNLTAAHYKQIGKALASLHLANITQKITTHRFAHSNLETCYKKQVKTKLPKSFDAILKDIEDRFKKLKKLRPSNLKSTLIHADLFPDNILWIKNTLHGIIDYEAAGLDSVLFDLCVAFHALCLTQKKLDLKKMKALLQGYESKRKLTANEKKALPYYLELTALRFLITRLKDMVIPNVPSSAPYFRNYREYVQRLQQVDGLEIKFS